MSIKNDLQRAKREQELELKSAQEAERVAQEHRSKLHQAILSQRQTLVDQWTNIVSSLLHNVGQATWGEDSYTLIEPDGVSSLSWFLVHVEGKKLNYKVTIQIKEANPDDPSLSPKDKLVRPSCFIVAGAQEFTRPLSEEGLKEAIVLAYKSGPKENGLDQWAESTLAKSQYKKGEYEVTNKWVKWVFRFTLLTFLMGVFYLLESNSKCSVSIALLGLGLVALSGIALWRTSFGKRFQRLRLVEKAVVVVAAIPGALIVFGMVAFTALIIIVVILMLIMIPLMVIAYASREKRVSEIEDGVRRAFR